MSVHFSAHRDGKDVVVAIKYDSSLKWYPVPAAQRVPLDHYHRHTFEDETVAEVMLDRLRLGMEERVRYLVTTAYNQGWKDAKSRARKKVTPTSCINNSGDTVIW